MASHKVKPSAPAKKSEAKTSKPSKPAKAFRSAEFIEDSDEETTKVVKKKQTLKTTPSVSSSTKLTKPKTVTFSTPPSKKRKSPSPSTEEEESGHGDTEGEKSSHSDEGSESEESLSAQDKSPTPARPKATASRLATNYAAVNKSDAKSQLNERNAPEKSSKRNSLSPRTASPSENEEDSESGEGGNGSGSESESSEQASREDSGEGSAMQKPVTSTQEQIIYEPPPGFEPATIVVHPSSQVMNIFSPANLEGKEIWHIAAPSSVPISTIRELSQEKILSRSSILSYEGSNYGLMPDPSTKEAFLLPSAKDNEYKSHNASTIQSFHLQQIVSLPHHVISPTKSTNQSVPIPQAHKRPPREQPKGLKMRYHPFGVVETSDNDTSSKDVPKVPQFRVPGAVQESPQKKRKRVSIDHGAQSSPVSSSKTKSKQPKVRQEATVDDHDNVMDIDSVDQPASHQQDTSKAEANGILENHTPKSARSKKTKLKATNKSPDHHPPQPSASQSLLPADIAEQAAIIMPEEVVTTGASALEITASEEKKAKRKRRKMEASKSAVKEQNVAKTDIEDVEMPDADESPSRDPEGQSASPGKSSVRKGDRATNEAKDEIQETPRKKASVANGERRGVDVSSKETKEERRKRKGEKRRRKMEVGKV